MQVSIDVKAEEANSGKKTIGIFECHLHKNGNEGQDISI